MYLVTQGCVCVWKSPSCVDARWRNKPGPRRGGALCWGGRGGGGGAAAAPGQGQRPASPNRAPPGTAPAVLPPAPRDSPRVGGGTRVMEAQGSGSRGFRAAGCPGPSGGTFWGTPGACASLSMRFGKAGDCLAGGARVSSCQPPKLVREPAGASSSVQIACGVFHEKRGMLTW